MAGQVGAIEVIVSVMKKHILNVRAFAFECRALLCITDNDGKMVSHSLTHHYLTLQKTTR